MIKNKCKFFVVFFLFSLKAFAEADPCDNLLNVVDRPNEGDSACVVKPGHLLIEVGYQYSYLFPENGYSSNYPQAEFRFGLPFHTEFIIDLPNYFREAAEHTPVSSGATATAVGFKHQFPDIGKWNFAAGGLVILPTGSPDFGSNAVGVEFGGIVSYDITSLFSIQSILGFSSDTDSFTDGGARFNSFNPQVTFTWQPKEVLQIYTEVFGQTKTSGTNGPGFSMDVGMLYLLAENIEIDLEYGFRLSGYLGNVQRYVGFGGAMMLW
jgi:hypothetical protein